MIETVKELVAAKADTAVALAKEIWGYAELSYEVLFHPAFVRGSCTTACLDRSLPELLDFSRRVDGHRGV